MRKGGLAVAAIMAVIALITYFGRSQDNPVTGETQHVAGISPDQEIALGLQAAPEMERQFGGLDPDPRAQELVRQVCARLIRSPAVAQTPYRFECHVLDDAQTLNAFALPGGQVFITEGLLAKLRTEGELAGVLGHEIGHVVGRHGAEHIAKQQLTQGLTGAAILATYDPDNPGSSRAKAAMAALVGQTVNMKFGRDDELESDKLGVRFMSEAGYDPRAMIGVMEVLSEGEGGRQPEFFSTHPNPDHRVERIREAIDARYPQGVPAGLES